jgi:hypothetical protein
MNFEITGVVAKELWSGNGAFLYTIIVPNEKARWPVFTKVKLEVNDDVTISGYCGSTKDKKVKDANGRDIWKTTFNAEHVKLNNQSDMPF